MCEKILKDNKSVGEVSYKLPNKVSSRFLSSRRPLGGSLGLHGSSVACAEAIAFCCVPCLLVTFN